MIRKTCNKNVYASRLRKKFNKAHNYRIGDLIRTPEGNIGEFQGISTHRDSSKISVILYSTDIDYDKEIKQLPETFLFNGHLVPINIGIMKRPEVVERDYV